MLDTIFSHWPFLAATFIFAMCGQVVKGTALTRGNVIKYKASKPWLGELLWWGRKTMPIHPIFAGSLLGLVEGMPVSAAMLADGDPSTAARCLYFAAAGLISTWAFDVLKAVLKKRNIELSSLPSSGSNHD